MADDQNTNSGGVVTGGEQQQQQTGATAADWITAIPEGPARDHVIAKGYKDPAALANANYNLMRIHTGSADVIERPKADATPEQMAEFYRTVNGIGTDTKYDLKFAEGALTDQTFVETAKSWFKDAGLRPDQAQLLADRQLAYATDIKTKQVAEVQAKRETEIAQLRQKYGKDGDKTAFDAVVANGQKAAQALGLTKDFLDRLDAANGPAVNIELLAMIGSKIGQEADFHDGGASNPLVSPEAARVELAKMDADKAIVDSLMNPRDPMHLVNMQRRAALQKVGYGKK